MVSSGIQELPRPRNACGGSSKPNASLASQGRHTRATASPLSAAQTNVTSSWAGSTTRPQGMCRNAAPQDGVLLRNSALHVGLYRICRCGSQRLHCMDPAWLPSRALAAAVKQLAAIWCHLSALGWCVHACAESRPPWILCLYIVCQQAQ